MKQKIRATVSINNAPSLKFIGHLMLPYHNILVDKTDITKEIALLSSVGALMLGLEMANATQLQKFRKLLESFPMLRELRVVRMDKVARDECLDIFIDRPFDDIGMLECVNNSLRTFSLLKF